MKSKDVGQIIALATQVIRYIRSEKYPRDIMALLKRIHTEATRLGGITANLSASELDTIEDYGVQLWNIASDLLLSFAPNVNPLLLEACTTLKAAAYYIIDYALDGVTDKQSMVQRVQMAIALGKGWIDCQQFNHATLMLQEAIKLDSKLHDDVAFDESTCRLKDDQCLLNLAKAELELVQHKDDQDPSTRHFAAACKSQNDFLHDKALYFLYLGAEIGQKILTSGIAHHALHWIANILSSNTIKTCDADLSVMILDLIGRLITKVDLSGMPKTTAVSHLIDIMSGLDRCFEINKAPNEFFFAKIHVLLQLFKSSENDKCYLIDLEEAYIAAMENISLGGDYVISWIASVFRDISQYIDFKSVARGAQMLIQRIAISADETSSLSVPLLHMTKIFLLSEAVCIQQSEKLVDLISSSIDSIFIVLDKFDDTDIACCQMILRKTADCLLQHGGTCHALAARLYTSAKALSTATLNKRVMQNALIQERRLLRCSLHTQNTSESTRYIEEQINLGGNYCNAVDYLMLADSVIRHEDNHQRASANIHSALSQLMQCEAYTRNMLHHLAVVSFSRKNKTALNQIVLSLLEQLKKPVDSHESISIISEILETSRWLTCIDRACLPVCSTTQTDAFDHMQSEDAFETFQHAFDVVVSVLQPLRNSQCTKPPSGSIYKNIVWFASAAWNLGLILLDQGTTKNGSKFLMQSYKFIKDMGFEAMISKPSRFICYSLSMIDDYMNNTTLDDHQGFLENDASQTIQIHYNCISLPIFMRHMRLETLVALERFDDAIIELNINSGKTGMISPTEISLCERGAERILLDSGCSLKDALQALEVVTSLLCQSSHYLLDHDITTRYAKWTRLKVTTSLVVGKTKGLEVTRQVVSDLKQWCPVAYPEDEIHYLIVITWNEGFSSFMNDDRISGSAWCTLSFDFLSLLRNQQKRDLLQTQLQEAYNDMGV